MLDPPRLRRAKPADGVFKNARFPRFVGEFTDFVGCEVMVVSNVQLEFRDNRTSSMRLIRHVFSTILSGFVFRPFLFFVIPGIIVGAFSLYVNFWMFVHFFEAVGDLNRSGIDHSFSDAFAAAYKAYPHTFIVGLLSLMLAIQLVGMGLIALQSKKYFEDLFHLGSTRLRDIRQRVK